MKRSAGHNQSDAQHASHQGTVDETCLAALLPEMAGQAGNQQNADRPAARLTR